MESKMKAKNELNGTDKDVSDGQAAVKQVVSDSASKRKGIGLALEIVLWVLAIFCLPIVNIILWVFRLCNLKRKHPERERVYMWVIFPFMVVADLMVSLMVVFIFYPLLSLDIDMLATIATGDAHYSGKEVGATKYGTAEALYELTGVRFPEITPVDSSRYEAWGVDPIGNMMHKYVLPEDVDESFYKRLRKACISDPEHWKITDSNGNGYYYHESTYSEENVFNYYSISVGIEKDTVTLWEDRVGVMPAPFYDGW